MKAQYRFSTLMDFTNFICVQIFHTLTVLKVMNTLNFNELLKALNLTYLLNMKLKPFCDRANRYR